MKDIAFNGELQVDFGDFVIIENDEVQRANLILQSEAGHWKQHPLLGAGIVGALNSQQVPQVQIRIALAADGIFPKKISNEAIEL